MALILYLLILASTSCNCTHYRNTLSPFRESGEESGTWRVPGLEALSRALDPPSQWLPKIHSCSLALWIPLHLLPAILVSASPGNQPHYDDALQTWTAPFVMAVINTKTVHRSNHLLDRMYGENSFTMKCL